MKTMRNISAPRMTGVRQSMEVQNAKKGVGRTLRRGLHGAKNWALEPEQDGTHRPVWVKAARVGVALTPAWLVLSAATGGQGRGGQDASLPKAILMALVVLLVGLGIFSARERRLGREEPWIDLPGNTESDPPAPMTLIDPAPEMPTEVLASPLVSGPSSGGEVVTPGDIPGIVDQTPQVDSEAVTQVVTHGVAEGGGESPFVQVNRGDRTDEGVVRSLVTEAPKCRIPEALDEETPTIPLMGGHPRRSPVTASLEKGQYPQVGAGEGVDSGQLSRTNEATTLGDELPEPPHSVWPVTGAATGSTQGELFPQVTTPAEVVTTPVTATPGPYPVTDEPIAETWWLDKPDIDPPDEEEAREEEPPVVTPEPAPSAPLDLEATPGPDAQQPQAEDLLGLDPAVVMYLALPSLPDATEETRERIRRAAAQWAQREIDAGRLSQRTAARALGVSKTTVAKWLGREPEQPEQPHDPWNQDEEGVG